MEERRLNIMEINFSRAWGGLEMQMPVIACGLKNLGHNVIAVCPEGSKASEVANSFGIKTIYLENKINYFDLWTIWKLSKIIKKNKIDIIHSHMAKDLWLIVPAAKIAGCPNIFFTRHIESHYKKRDLFHFFLHRSLTGAVAITHGVKESLISTTHIPEDKITVIYCGLDLIKFNPEFLPNDILRKEYNLPHDCFLIGIIGRLEKSKGQEYLLHAAPHILKNFPNVKFFIIGEETKGENSDYKRYLESMVQKLGIGNDVFFTGFRQDIPSLMNSLDVVTLLSEREAFGLVIIEAMAMGKTVIATESDGTREIIDNNIDGFLIPSQNSESLAEKIIEILNNPALKNKIGMTARKKVEDKFELNKNIRQLEKLFYGKINK